MPYPFIIAKSQIYIIEEIGRGSKTETIAEMPFESEEQAKKVMIESFYPGLLRKGYLPILSADNRSMYYSTDFDGKTEPRCLRIVEKRGTG